MVSVLLLEDKHHARRLLKKMVSENPFVDSVFDTPSGNEAISFARKHKTDIALLDIELAPEEGINGIQVAKHVYHFNPETHIVFISAHHQYVFESFAVHPYHYLLKPVNEDEVKELINSLADKIRNGARNSPQKIKIKVENEILLISPRDILFVEKQNKCSLIHTESKVYKICQTLSELENKLEGNFLRVHQSFVVSMDKISKIREVSKRSYEIGFDGYEKVALMSRYKFEEHKHKFTPL